jgi:hypothetical protein
MATRWGTIVATWLSETYTGTGLSAACPLWEVKRTPPIRGLRSANDPERTFRLESMEKKRPVRDSRRGRTLASYKFGPEHQYFLIRYLNELIDIVPHTEHLMVLGR